MKIKLLFIITILIIMSFSDDKPAYRIFNGEGKEVNYSKMIDALNKADVIFFGEFHDNPICHWLEYEVTKDLAGMNPKGITLGAEMFEADNQLIVDEYLKGYMKDNKFEEEARLWPNYKTDYKPLISFAKEKHYTFVATNVPRRYANMVYRSGFEVLDSLSGEAKKYFSPLPVMYDSTWKCYAELIETGKNMGHDNPNLPKAQALKDATMAYFIHKNLEKKKLFIHFNGSYHTDRYEGIVKYLKEADDDLKILTISTVEQDDIEELKEEDKGLADYIIAVPVTMTKTYQKN